jgi:hypothetical protein
MRTNHVILSDTLTGLLGMTSVAGIPGWLPPGQQKSQSCDWTFSTSVTCAPSALSQSIPAGDAIGQPQEAKRVKQASHALLEALRLTRVPSGRHDGHMNVGPHQVDDVLCTANVVVIQSVTQLLTLLNVAS